MPPRESAWAGRDALGKNALKPDVPPAPSRGVGCSPGAIGARHLRPTPAPGPPGTGPRNRAQEQVPETEPGNRAPEQGLPAIHAIPSAPRSFAQWASLRPEVEPQLPVLVPRPIGANLHAGGLGRHTRRAICTGS